MVIESVSIKIWVRESSDQSQWPKRGRCWTFAPFGLQFEPLLPEECLRSDDAKKRNTAAEGAAFAERVESPNCKVLLDTLFISLFFRRPVINECFPPVNEAQQETS